MNNHANAMIISRRAGFTVIELMITVAIIAILSTIAAPSMRDVIKNSRMTSLANDLMSDLSVARGEAVNRGVRTTVCTSSDGAQCTATEWRFGWIVLAEVDTGGTQGVVDLKDVIVKKSPKINGADETPPNRITTTNHTSAAGVQYVGFRPSGVTTPGGGDPTTTTIHFYLCDSRSADTPGVSAAEALNKGRHITVTGTGRAQVNRCTCSTGLVCAP